MIVRLRHILIIAAICLAFTQVAEAAELTRAPLESPVRTAIAGPNGQVIYAVTDQPPALVRIDSQTGASEVLHSLPHAGTKLVWDSRRNALAILFPYADATALYDVVTTKLTTQSVGENPTDLTALTEGGFAVANAFSDSVSMIGPDDAGSLNTLNGVVSMPTRIASTGEYVVVAAREPASLWVYRMGSTQPQRKVKLETVPLSMHTWTRDRILLRFPERVEVLNVVSGNRTIVIDSGADNVATQGARVLVTLSDSLREYDEGFDLIRTETLEIIGVPILVGANGFAILDASNGALYLPGDLLAITQAPAPEVVESTDEPEVAPAPELDPDPRTSLEMPDRSGDELLVIRRRAIVVPEPPDYNVEEIRGFDIAREEAASHSGQSKYAVRPGRTRLDGRRPYAPLLSEKQPVPLRTAIQQSTSINTHPDSLFNVDATQEPEIERIGKLTLRSEQNQTLGSGGVAFNLDNALFQSERFEQDDNTGTLRMEENVHVTTSVSDLKADSLFIRRHPPVEEESQTPAYPLVPFGYDLSIDDPLNRGAIEAYQLHLIEDNREFDADYLYYDSAEQTGELINPHGHSGPFYFSADRIRIVGLDEYDSEDLWITTCELPEPHYRIRLSRAELRNGELVDGRNVRLQLGKFDTPLYIPRLSGIRSDDEGIIQLDLDAGSRSVLGAYVNYGQWYQVTKNIDGAVRLYPTTREGVGYGIDVDYDYMDDPAALLFRSRGELKTLHTTEDRGYTHWYHRQELGKRTQLLAQWEQWYDREFYKDFYNDLYEDRTGPRTFANVTHLRAGTIITATASKGTHDFLTETEKLPEGTVHVLERTLAKNVYFTMDSVVGRYRNVPSDFDAQRYSQSARLSYDWNVMQGLNIVPFVEGGAIHYSETLAEDESDTRWVGLIGTTAQARFTKTFKGFGRFAQFKHIIIPSVTYFEQDSSSLREDEVPRFDTIDSLPTRRRVESKIDNVILGRNAYDDQVWRVARLALYQGNDVSNDARETTDYEADLEIRPRPWWGIRAIGEHHRLDEAVGLPGQDQDRVLSYIFYDDSNFENRFNARLGFALTDVEGLRLNRELLYGAGYKLSPLWSVSAEHRYDLEDDSVTRQTYELRRRLHKWEMGLRLRDRPTGTDVNVVFSLSDIAGTRISF